MNGDLKMNSSNRHLEPSRIAQLENLGYALLPKLHPESPGFSGLLVAIRQEPTNAHYDPESISLLIRNRNSLASKISFTLTSFCADMVQVCPGTVILTDRRGKRIDFFTFGGQLETTDRPEERIFFLYSPVPILEIFNDLNSFSDQLAFEVEGLLARQHAQWARDDEGFARKMAQVDPTQLYLASLHEILARYGHNRDLRNSWSDFYSKLLAEKQWLESEHQWTGIGPGLGDLLAPSNLEPNLHNGGIA
jgi:hypothetical protein